MSALPSDGFGQRAPELIERLRAEVERAPGGRITEKELAELGVDPSTARRQFKRHYGTTFQAYHRARRMDLALHQVRETGNVAEAKSPVDLREAFNRIFGEPPSLAKRRAPLFVSVETLGMVAIADDAGLRLLEFADRRALECELTILRRRLGTNIVPGTHPHLEAIREQIAEYFAGKRFEFTVPNCADRFRFSATNLEGAAIRSACKNALLFLDGQRTRKGRSQPRRWTRQRE